ncbi:MAG: hypothetical protein P8183_15685, partial [Anaerolineae bacterium]
QSNSVQSTIGAAEGFIDAVGADGTGFPLIPSDGLFDSSTETAFSDIPLPTINLLDEGTHTIYVHGQDAAGNWGSMSTVDLIIDKTAPIVGSASVSPNPTNGATAVTLSATATDAVGPITQAEWFVGADPGPGNGSMMTVLAGGPPWTVMATIDVSTWADGDYTLNVRVKDAAGNWSLASSTILTVYTPPPPFAGLTFSTRGNGSIPGVAGPFDNADIYTWDGTNYSRLFDGNAGGGNPLPGNANIDGLVMVDATHFYLSFAGGNTAVPTLGNVQDEDVVEYNNGTWSLYFDGTAAGLGATNGQDIDAFDIVGGVMYFSTVGNGTIPGVGGPYDVADIYTWDGTNFSRVWDASANGMPGNADVDGLVVIDATHFYASFAAANTTTPGVGAVPDVNVVFNNAGVWSTYFDGTANGLAAGSAQDLDAISIP